MLAQSVTKTQYKVSDFLTWQKSGRLILTPKFQRRPVWRTGAKSYLLDTIIRGFPIPIIFLREEKTDLRTLEHKRQVVDGQQRIRTVLSFVKPSSLGSDYDPEKDKFYIDKAHDEALAGLDFSELPHDVQQAILDYEFSVQVLPSSMDDRQVIQVFARMNATGYKLNPQELRNSRYFGEFKTSMYMLAAEQLSRWERWGLFTWNNIARMNEVEITSEFGQLMLAGIVGKSQKTLDSLYDAKNVDFPERKRVEKRFRTVMDLIDDNLGDRIAQTVYKKRAPFYGLFAAVYDLTYGIARKIDSTRPKSLPHGFAEDVMSTSEKIEEGNAPKDVMKSLERRTTHPGSRRIVVAYLKKELA